MTSLPTLAGPLFLLLLVGLGEAAYGQAAGLLGATPSLGAEASLEVWIERSDLPDGHVSFIAKARRATENSTALEREADASGSSYTYELHLHKSGISGTALNRQSGEFSLTGAKPIIFAQARYVLGSGDSVAVRLVVADASGTLAADVATVRSMAPVPSSNLVLQTESNGARSDTDQSAHVPTQLLQSLGSPPEGLADVELEIDGLILDETRTKLGRDFYDLFYGKWIAPQDARDYAIMLIEAPARGRLVSISVEVDDRPVYRRMLQPRRDLLAASADQAVRAVADHLTQRSQIDAQLDDEDRSNSGL